MSIEHDIENYLQSLAPHVAQRKAAALLREAVVEINKLKQDTKGQDYLDAERFRFINNHDLHISKFGKGNILVTDISNSKFSASGKSLAQCIDALIYFKS